MIWDGDLMALLAKNNFDKEYYTKTIFTVSTCAWFRETVMRRGLCTLYDQSPSALCLGNPVARDLHVVIGRTLAGRRALSNHVCAHSVISMWHVVCLQHLARACSEQSRSTTVLPINHVIQMPQCLSGFVTHDYSDRPLKAVTHDDVIKWKHFPRNWPFVRGIHRSRWIPHTKASDAKLWCFLWLWRQCNEYTISVQNTAWTQISRNLVCP